MHEFDPNPDEPRLITRSAEPDELTPPPRRRWLDPDRPPPTRARKIVGAFFPVIVVLVLIVAFGSRYFAHRALLAALPQMDGTLSVSGLSAPVTVVRDARGVPHIRAANLDDLVLAQGYVTAQDRLWQLDALRRNAAGDLAEVLGSSFVSHDRTQRLLQMRASAERALAALPDDQRHALDQYARGVNAAIAAQRDHLPFEFVALRYKPAPWTPTDSVLIGLSMFQQLNTSYAQKLSREAVAAHLAPDLMADLYPEGSWRDHPPAQTLDLTMPVDEMEQVPLDESQSLLRDPDLATPAHAAALLANLPACPGCAPGSNNWVVSGEHSTTGKPILANDTHLAHTLPGTWYETDLEAGSFHAAGLAIPGTPFIEIGHNGHLAWGFTVLPADLQDVYVEHLRTNNNTTEYQTADQTWHPVQHRAELIHVRNGLDVTLDVEFTRHGSMDTPVISGIFAGEKRALSLRSTLFDPSTLGFPFGDMDAAQDWPSFSAALAKYGGPPMNLVYADDQGHIAFHAIGRIPIRGSDPAQPQPIAPMPTDATAPDAAMHEWSGYIPYDQLPASLDPAGGILATANARTAPDHYPIPITLNWAAPYRNERLWKMLAAKPKFAPAEMLGLQTDIYSDLDHVIGERLAYAIDHATLDTSIAGIDQKRLHQAADLLRTWNGEVDANSPAPAIVDSARAALWPLLLSPHLGKAVGLYNWGSRDYALEQIVMHTPDRWLPKQYKTWDDLLVAAVISGFRSNHAPLDLNQWTSGSLRAVDIEHPIYSQSDLLRSLVAYPIGTGLHPQSGDTTTVKQVDHSFGPSERLTVDLADPDRTTLNLVLGQSGNPASPNFMDQFPAWLSGQTFPLPFTHEATAATVTHKLTLKPESR